jgi:uncharacterized membrane protein
MRIFGHPIHVMLIHFPIGLLPMEFVLSGLAYIYQDTLLATAAFYCGVGGVATGYVAMLTGLLDLIAIPKENKPAMGTGLLHGFINGLVVLVYTVFVYKAWQAYPNVNVQSLATLLVKGLLVGCLLFGNFLGGRLIYQHHIGINKS